MSSLKSELNASGMAMIINEAPELHPSLPVGFPTCGNYDIGADGFKKSVARASTYNHGKSKL